ncbi:ADP-ribosylglycohydrolase family protein [Candidatus Sumerlaeota bacterium]|nr:ADP-ribosylglycohydrolase family protein [Candidatus Sumerlaeota bacterium]
MNRFEGCLLGLAVGDALGAPVENMKAGRIRQIFGEVTGYVDPIEAQADRPGRWRLQGLYTDDTQQALAVADTLAVCGEADVRALADLYVRLADEGPSDAPFGSHRGTGHFFRRAVDALRAGVDDPRAAGQPSAGNGAAMRIAPVGLYYADDEEALGRATVEFSLVTHSDPRAIAAALAVARVVAVFARRQLPSESTPSSPFAPSASSTPHGIASDLPDWIRIWEERLDDEWGEFLDPSARRTDLHRFSDALRSLGSLVREANDTLAAQSVVRIANESNPLEKIAQCHAGFAVASVVMALYRALSSSDFTRGMIAAVNEGGDADTVGAIVGAILGARFGAESIPAEWIDGLINADQIRLRGRALREREVDWGQWEDLVEMEKTLTAREMGAMDRGQVEHRKEIERKARKDAEKRARSAQAREKSPAQDLGFAPPPEVWLRGGAGGSKAGPGVSPRDDLDPIQAKKEKALRGRKRIEWKEGRRQKERERSQGDDEHDG